MSTRLLRSLLLVGAGLLWGGLAQAQCPPGMYPFQFAPNQPSSCAPIPGNGNQQAPQAPAEQWEDRWGAIAIDGKKGVLGAATGMNGKRSAERAAIADCQAQGGTACKADMPYRNSCAAVITGDTTHNSGTNPSLNAAIEKGMKACAESGDRNCRTYYTDCSLPVRIR